MTNELMSHFSDVMSGDIDSGKKVTHEQLGEQIEAKLEDSKFWRKLELGDGVRFLLAAKGSGADEEGDSLRRGSVIGATALSSSRAATTTSSRRRRRTTSVSRPASSFARSGFGTNRTAATSAVPSSSILMRYVPVPSPLLGCRLMRLPFCRPRKRTTYTSSICSSTRLASSERVRSQRTSTPRSSRRFRASARIWRRTLPRLSALGCVPSCLFLGGLG